jgi:serine/threonine protein kinase
MRSLTYYLLLRMCSLTTECVLLPGNILISVQGSLKLADFGLSKIKDHEAGRYRMTGVL